MYKDKLSLTILQKVFEFLEETKGETLYSEFFDVEGGYAFKSSDYANDGAFVLRVTNISPDGSIDNKTDNKFVKDKELIEELSSYILNENDILIVMVGGSLGKVGIVPKDVLPALLNQNLWRVKNNKGFASRYVYYLSLYLNEFKAIIKTSSHGHFSRKKYRELKIPKVDSKESFAVVNYLDKVLLEREIPINSDFEQCSNQLKKVLAKEQSISRMNYELSHQLGLVRQLRQAFLSEAMQGRLISQDNRDEPAEKLLEKIKVEKEKLLAEKKIKRDKPLSEIKVEDIPFEIPVNWSWCRFADIAVIESNLVSPFDYPNLPHVAPDNIEKNTGKLLSYKTVLEDEVKSANHYFYPKQLIYSKVRPKLNKVVLVDFEGLCSADMYPIKPLIESIFLQFTMLSEYFLVEVDKFDNRVKMPKINQTQLAQIPIPVPPLAEQKRIVEKLEKLMAYCDDLEANIKESKSQAESLLQVALKEALEPKVELELTA